MTPTRQALLAAAAFALVACGSTGSAPPAAPPSPPATASKAADLRVDLDTLLGEHVLLGARTTDAALAGRSDEYAAYASQLTHNATDIGALLGGVLGVGAQNRLDQLWAAHDSALVQYTAAVAAQDQAARDRATQQLETGFVTRFADLFAGATGLPRDALTRLATNNVQRAEQLVEDQGGRSWAAVCADVRGADADAQQLGDTLAAAIVRRQASRLPGAATGRAVDLRATLDQLLQEHAYLVTGASAAAIAGRTEQLLAIEKALEGNGADLGRALGAVAGADVESQLGPLWSTHDTLLEDYATAVARGDRGGQQRAVADLNDVSAPQVASFLASATGMSRSALTNLLRQHVATTRDVVDAQNQHDAASAARRERESAQHMAMIGDALTAALVRKQPQKFL